MRYLPGPRTAERPEDPQVKGDGAVGLAELSHQELRSRVVEGHLMAVGAGGQRKADAGETVRRQVVDQERARLAGPQMKLDANVPPDVLPDHQGTDFLQG